MGLGVEAWTQVYEFFDRDDFVMMIAGSWLVTVLTVWSCNAFLLPMDLTGKPEFLTKYKVQPALKGQPVDSKKVWGAVRTALFNQLLTAPLGAVVYLVAPPEACDPKHFPSGWLVLRDLIGSTLCVEVAFYYTHRLIHYGPLYKSFHKKHHEWTAPIGITAIYAHPVEFLCGNVFPVIIGPIVMRSHMFTTWLWYVIALTSTTLTHSGYHFPLLPQSPQFHDFHHLKFNSNYGSIGLLDWLHGTDAVFRKSVQFKRHKRMVFSATPMDELYPDEKSTGRNVEREERRSANNGVSSDPAADTREARVRVKEK